MAVLIALLSLVLNSNPPLANILQPMSTNDFGVQFEIPIQIPFLDGRSYVVLYLSSAGVESTPFRVRIKGERLSHRSVSMTISDMEHRNGEHSRRYVPEHHTGPQGSY